jgi:hypothetical protein
LALQTQILPPTRDIGPFPADGRIDRIASAARELLDLARSPEAALDLTAELARMLIGVPDVAIRKVAATNGFTHSSADQDLPVRSTVAAPIYEKQRIIGHLEISSNELGAFDEQDFRTLSLLAALASAIASSIPAPTPAREVSPKLPPLSTRIASRLEGMLPTIRVRLVP